MGIRTSKKTIPKKILTAQEHIGLHGIQSNGILATVREDIFAYIAVKANNSGLLDSYESQSIANQLYTALERERYGWQLISLPQTVDITSIVNNLAEWRSSVVTHWKLRLLDAELSYVRNIVKTDCKEPMLFIKIWSKFKGQNSVTRLLERAKELEKRLCEVSGVKAVHLGRAEVAAICRGYSELLSSQSKEDLDYIISDDSNTILNMATPVGGIEYRRTGLTIGGVEGKVYIATKYPNQLNQGFLKAIMANTSAITCITYIPPEDNNLLATQISNSISTSLNHEADARKYRDKKRLERKVADGDSLLTKLDEENAQVGYIRILTMPIGADENELHSAAIKTETLFKAQRIHLRVLGLCQKEGFAELSPYHKPQPIVGRIGTRLFLLEALADSGMLEQTSYKDNRGMYLAKTKDNTNVILDFFQKGEDRTNSNILITGKSGSGKSTAAKSIILTLLINGVNLIIIDPEREYMDICRELGGTYVNAGGGTCINILEPRQTPDEDGEIYRDRILHNHLSFLESFFRMYRPELNDKQISLIKKSVMELYSRFGIESSTDIVKLPHTAFPTISDLCKLLREKAYTSSEDVLEQLFDIENGDTAAMWNGHTNIDIDSELVVFDTNAISNSSERLQTVQYYNLLSIAWKKMSEDRTSRYAIICDEAHMLGFEGAMRLVRSISKRARKYEGMLVLITQALSDFLSENMRVYGEDLVNNAVYKFLFSTDGEALKLCTEIFKLTKGEQRALLGASRGNSLAMIGDKRLELQWEIPEYRIQLMGKGGGS